MLPNATDRLRKAGSANASPPISRYGPRSTDHERGSLVVHTSDGQAHEFDSGEVPRQAIDDLQDRVRRYKR